MPLQIIAFIVGHVLEYFCLVKFCDVFVNGASAIAKKLNISPLIIGLTYVTSVIAAKKGQNEIALGNVIGFNIFNIIFVLGLSCLVSLLTGSQIIVDVLVMLGVTLLVFILSLKGKIGKKEGVLLFCLYAVYLGYLVIRTI